MHNNMKSIGASKRVLPKEKEKERPPVLKAPDSPGVPFDSDDNGRPWTHHASRPCWADPPKDNSFTLEDEAHATTVESVMSCFAVIESSKDDLPLIFVSPGYEKMTGFAAEEVLGENFNFLQRKKQELDALQKMREGMSAKRFVSVELTNFRKDGRKYRSLVCLLPVLDGSDTLCKYLMVHYDLEKKEDRVAHSPKWTEQVSTYVRAFAITDSTQEGAPIWSVNEAFTTLTGYSQSEIRGISILALGGPDSSKSNLRKLLSGHWTEKPTSLRMMCYKRDGTPFCGYLWSCPLWEHGLGNGPCRRHLVVVSDITTSKMRRMGKFIMGKVIGQGASGVVYKGMNPQTEEVVAIKTVDASRFRSISEIEQMQEEMNVSASLKHPNIVRLFEVNFNNNVFYLVMELSSGGSLMKYIHERGAANCLDEAETHRLFVQMVSALDYCHRRRIIHRDLKPENILMDNNNNIKIADFGLAAISGFSSGLTLQCGTPEFTAPEITTGKEYEGASIDIWSLGVILYEMLTGKLPFQGATQALLFKAIQKGVYDPLPYHISDHCKDLLSGMLTTNPSRRSTMDDIIRHPWLKGVVGQGEDGEAKASGGGLDGADSDSSDDMLSPTELSNNASMADIGNTISESVRIVIPGGIDKDDPITAAMMRSHGIMTEDDDAGRSSQGTPPHGADKPGSHNNGSSTSGRGGRASSIASGSTSRSVRSDLTDSRAARTGGMRAEPSGMRAVVKGAPQAASRKQPLPPLASSSNAGGAHSPSDRRPTHEVAKDMMSRAGRSTAATATTSPTDSKGSPTERDRRGHAEHSPTHRNLPPLSRRA